MALSVFEDRARPPSEDEVRAALGRAHAAWQSLRGYVHDNFGPVADEWGYPGKKYGWSLRLKKGKRIIVYMTPCRKHFIAAVVLGDRAYAVAHERGLPKDILTVLDAATRYAEGRGIRLEIRTAVDVRAVEQLVAVKMEP